MVADRVRLAFSRDDRLFVAVGFSKRGEIRLENETLVETRRNEAKRNLV